MTDNDSQFTSRAENLTSNSKSRTTVVLMSVSALLYVAALFANITIFDRLQPVILIIIGYCLARFPALQIEKTLRAEILRQAQKADAAQYAKERTEQHSEILEEKLKNVKTALRANSIDILSSIMPENGGHSHVLAKSASTRSSIKTALKILDS